LPPDGADIPSLRVRCSAKVVRHPGFATVSLYFVSPPNAPTVRFPDTLYQMSNFDSLPGTGSIEAGRWLFVVTSNAVREVIGPEFVVRMGGGTALAPEYDLYQGKWARGGATCEGRGMGGGIVFISVCKP
jgi:hypothetical protein